MFPLDFFPYRSYNKTNVVKQVLQNVRFKTINFKMELIVKCLLNRNSQKKKLSKLP